MESFEIHITGSENILSILNELEIKSLHAEIKNPKNETIAVEYMSSFVREFNNYEDSKKWVDDFVNILEEKGVEIYRVKIECPYYYEHYKENSVYVEAHFPTNENNKEYPFIYNVRSKKYTSTDRKYLKSEYPDFIEKWKDTEKVEIEYCLYDDNIRFDDIYIRLFNKIKL